jgi:hypothetical protein
MPNERKPDSLERVWLAQRLVKETGITEREAYELIGLLGAQWSSLVREAQLLRRQH